VRAVRETVATWPVAAAIEWAPGPLHALRRQREMHVDLVIADKPSTTGGTAALHNDLRAHAAAPLSMLVFDDRVGADLVTDALPYVGAWQDLPETLQWWSREHLTECMQERANT
jgi:hypothetical protein